MRRSTRLILTTLGILVVVGLVGYAAHSLDIVGMIVRAHTPPQH
jgi:hypothetical protein